MRKYKRGDIRKLILGFLFLFILINLEKSKRFIE